MGVRHARSGHSMRQRPQPGSAGRGWVICALYQVLESSPSGREGGRGVNRGLSQEAPRAKLWTGCDMPGEGWGEGPWSRSLIAPLPARLPGHLLVQKGGQGAARADTSGGWVGKRSGPAERLLQLLAGRWGPGAGKLGITEEGRGVKRQQQQHM